MAVVLLVAALALLSLPGSVRPLGQRLRPSEWARLSATVLCGGAVALEAALIALAAPTALRAVGVPALAAACRRMMGGLALGGAPVGWVAAAAALAVPALAGRGLARARATHRLARAEPWLGTHHDCRLLPQFGEPVERARALEVDPAPPWRPGRAAVWSPTLGLAVLSVVSLGDWLGQARMMLAMAGLCRA